MKSSISYNQQDLISDILSIHCPQGIELDVCYSKGGFYKNGKVKQPQLKFDLYPQTTDTIAASSDNLPLLDNSISSIMLDPPFLGGASSKKTGIISSRFNWFRTMGDVFSYYGRTIKECSRVLNDNGILIFKCQNITNCGKKWSAYQHILNEAEKAGLVFEDEAILLAKSRLIDKRWKRQLHLRSFHSFFLVFKKKPLKIKPTKV